MVEHRQHRARHQPRAARALGGGGEEEHRVGAIAAIVMKIMLDDADVRKSERLGFLGEGKRITKIVRTGFLIGSDIGKELHPKLHAGEPRMVVKTTASWVSSRILKTPHLSNTSRCRGSIYIITIWQP